MVLFPLSTAYKRIGTHVLFWTLYMLYETVYAGWEQQDYLDLSQIIKVWTNFPFIIATVYVNLYVLMPRFLYQKKYVLYIFSLTVLIVSWALFTRFLGYQFWLDWDRENAYQRYVVEPKNFFVPVRIARNAFRLYPVLALTMLIKVLRNSSRREKQLRQAEAERHKSELSYLKAQLHPHFFFNTLSSLYSLALKKSDKTPDIVMKMSGLMHYMLYEIDTKPVLLSDEIGQLKNYIAIEELRFGDRVEYSFQSSGPLEEKKIIPLLLMPFVENAFKHSLGDEINKAWVTIDIKLSGNQLYFVVENSISNDRGPKPVKGIGLENVRKRLALSYPDCYELNIGSDDNMYSVNLKLQLN